MKPPRVPAYTSEPGESKYSEECAKLREELDAQAVFLLVVNGKKGNGIAQEVQAPVSALPAVLSQISYVLETCVKRLQKEIQMRQQSPKHGKA